MKKIFLAAIGILVTGISAIVIFIAVFKIPIVHAQYYKYSKHPNDLVDEFIIALNDNDFNYAKELVIPGLRERIDQWKIASGHDASPCERGDLIEPYAGGTGTGPFLSGNKATFETMSYACYYGNQASITIDGVILIHNLGGWVITDWDKICFSSISKLETCY